MFYPSSGGHVSPTRHPTVAIDPADGQEPAFALIDTNSYTCASAAPSIAQHVQGVIVLARGGPGK
jgi:hypothetical protein